MWDCAIIGGGPAGLTAATYLGRFKRDVVLIDAGASRLKRVPHTRNTPGFPDGIAGADLLARLQDQASRYGALFRAGTIETIERTERGFDLRLGSEHLKAKTVLLATGAHLTEPDLPNLDEALWRGLIRYCPICDGYEAHDKNIAVLGARSGGIAEAHFLRTYSDHVTYLWQGEGEPTGAERNAAEARGIRVAQAPVKTLRVAEQVEAVCGDSPPEAFDVLYPCLGCDPQSELARQAGARVSPEGGVIVDALHHTTIKRLYAAGDVLQGLDQIASACGQAAIAAVAIHNALREQDEVR